MKPTQTGYSRLTIWPGGAAADGGVGVLRDGAEPVSLFCSIEKHRWRHVYLRTHTHMHTIVVCACACVWNA